MITRLTPYALLAALALGCESTPASTASDASPTTDATPTDATPTDATPTDATPTDATPTDATPTDATPTDATPITDAASDTPSSGFALTSTAFVDRGTLPAEYTCDGVGHSPPLAWTGVPAGTTEFAVMMTTLARDGLKWNWVLHTIPGATRSLAMASMGVGVSGITSDGPALAYSPPCSRGPGPMQYTFTVYALSGHPMLPTRPADVTGAVLTAAIGSLTLASASATVTYTR